MNYFNLKKWGLTTWISALITAAICLIYFCHLLFGTHSSKIPHLAYCLSIIGSVIFTGLSISHNIPDKRMINYTWIIVLVIIVIPWCIFEYSGWEPNANILKFIIDYCAVIASTFSIVFVSYTLKLQRQQLHDSNRLTEQMRDKEVLQMIDVFLSPEMLKHKELCSELKDQFHLNPQAVTNMLSYAFERGIYDDCHLDPLWAGFKASKGYAEYAAFIRLARFFNLISRAPLSETTARSVHYYYVWWRKFMIDITDIYNNTWDRTIPSRRLVPFKASWIEACDRLDNIMKQYNLPVD